MKPKKKSGMEFGTPKWLLWVGVMLFSCPAHGQSMFFESSLPPTLGVAEPLGKNFRPYKEETNRVRVVTVKFKITREGVLDTLLISPNAPIAFAAYVKQHLLGLNGQWKPQLTKGKPDRVSKWLITNLYMAGFIEGEGEVDSCPQNQFSGFLAAYDRERSLFSCPPSAGRNTPEDAARCLTKYIEGSNYFLYAPILSTVVR